MGFGRWFVAPIIFGLTGCQHALEWRALNASGGYERSYSDAQALALESDGRRRVLIESAQSHEGLGGETLLLYLSFKVDPIHGIDLKHPKVFLSLSDVAMSFSGFLSPEALEAARGPRGEMVSGHFAGKVRGEGEARGQIRDIDVTLEKAPIVPVDSRTDFDRKGYSQTIRDHMYRLEFDAKDREYWRAPDAPAAKNPPGNGDSSTREHN